MTQTYSPQKVVWWWSTMVQSVKKITWKKQIQALHWSCLFLSRLWDVKLPPPFLMWNLPMFPTVSRRSYASSPISVFGHLIFGGIFLDPKNIPSKHQTSGGISLEDSCIYPSFSVIPAEEEGLLGRFFWSPVIPPKTRCPTKPRDINTKALSFKRSLTSRVMEW